MSCSDLSEEATKYGFCCNNDRTCTIAETKDHMSTSFSMTRSWSADSLSRTGGIKSCVCAPTTHAGSFRCRLHRLTPAQPPILHLPPTAAPSMSSTSPRAVKAQWHCAIGSISLKGPRANCTVPPAVNWPHGFLRPERGL
eukprot:Gb_15834 [translate_table: standard]